MVVAMAEGRGWIRRLAPDRWLDEVPSGEHESVVRSAWLTAMVATVETAGVEWLTALARALEAEDKLLQLRLCGELGIVCPRTVVVTDRARIPDSLGETVVVKPLARGDFRTSSGEARVVYATATRRDEPLLDALGGAPFLIQELVPAKAHLRVVTVGEQAWVCSLDADGLPVDWRSNKAAHSSFRAVHRERTGAAALSLARRLGVGYSSQDWIVTADDRDVFLELNPGGQWLFLPDNPASAVTDAVAKWLVGT